MAFVAALAHVPDRDQDMKGARHGIGQRCRHHGCRQRHGGGGGALAGRDGFKVAILSSSGKGEALANELGGIGVTGSNQSEDDLKRLVDMAMDNWGRIDVLVNSAGHGPRAPVLELTDEDWHQGMEVYFLNVVRPTRLVTPIMQRQKAGAIINISTFAAFEPDPTFPTSGVFRAGLAAFAKLFADKYAAENIRMNNVLPGFIDSLPERAEFKERIPMGRYGKTTKSRKPSPSSPPRVPATSPARTSASTAASPAPSEAGTPASVDLTETRMRRV